ncbi:unnamed protein product, partial [Symbiodinium sp. KB8]
MLAEGEKRWGQWVALFAPFSLGDIAALPRLVPPTVCGRTAVEKPHERKELRSLTHEEVRRKGSSSIEAAGALCATTARMGIAGAREWRQQRHVEGSEEPYQSVSPFANVCNDLAAPRIGDLDIEVMRQRKREAEKAKQQHAEKCAGERELIGGPGRGDGVVIFRRILPRHRPALDEVCPSIGRWKPVSTASRNSNVLLSRSAVETGSHAELIGGAILLLRSAMETGSHHLHRSALDEELIGGHVKFLYVSPPMEEEWIGGTDAEDSDVRFNPAPPKSEKNPQLGGNDRNDVAARCLLHPTWCNSTDDEARPGNHVNGEIDDLPIDMVACDVHGRGDVKFLFFYVLQQHDGSDVKFLFFYVLHGPTSNPAAPGEVTPPV